MTKNNFYEYAVIVFLSIIICSFTVAIATEPANIRQTITQTSIPVNIETQIQQNLFNRSLPFGEYTPMPYSGTNVLPFPLAWVHPDASTPTGGLSCGHSVGNPYSDDSNLALDAGQPYDSAASLRIDAATAFNTVREANGPWQAISPGDHIFISVKIKTGTSSLGDSDVVEHGGRLGIDLYEEGTGHRITAIQSDDGTPARVQGRTPEWAANQDSVFIHWSNHGFTEVTIDFVVAATYTGDGYGEVPFGTSAIPSHCVVWLQGIHVADTGHMWFADSVMYINPVSAVEAPVFVPPAGVYDAAQNVAISSATTAAVIYYTNDGSVPDSGDTEYTVPVNVPIGSTTLKALATKAGLTDSTVSIAIYQVNDPIVPSSIAVMARVLGNMRRA